MEDLYLDSGWARSSPAAAEADAVYSSSVAVNRKMEGESQFWSPEENVAWLALFLEESTHGSSDAGNLTEVAVSELEASERIS